MRIAFEGNVGSGKSEILRHMEGRVPGFTVVQEPTAEWEELLRDYYGVSRESVDATAMALQLRVFADRVLRTPPVDCLMERSPYTQQVVFVRAQEEAGRLSRRHCAQLEHLLSTAMDHGHAFVPDAFVFVHTPLGMCLARARERDKGMPLAEGYMTILDRLHRDALMGLRVLGHRVMVVDGLRSPSEVADEVTQQIAVWRGFTREEAIIPSPPPPPLVKRETLPFETFFYLESSSAAAASPPEQGGGGGQAEEGAHVEEIVNNADDSSHTHCPTVRQTQHKRGGGSKNII